ncbi:glycoside hydrolase family 31 protein [Bacteroides uniformis]|uniref:Glycoside hydrolase family 31 protein n=1 Tax=Bacteroides uniformis TaxID=820 RepID=A0A6I0LGQ2_BACUN|nr:TIM-barrel domain-containing protein [Bacteroides uniformis]KAB4249305.1 glycoside hydrolase family 31 protein [Bacteroides uniformis]KAB4251707.1 glycoside hydrolase family 31 protein [Bacteroides uniformis]KAB4252256.1 glycoside hydrolase family 31 protein [Bacteroides uniformis]KAB4262481.1 glycoside hydrolase family 31 protein [Bacteroides uniformis]
MKKELLAVAMLLFAGGNLLAQPHVNDGTSYLMNQPLDMSTDFRDLSNTLFFADHLESFDVKSGEGLVNWKRGHLMPRQAFNTNGAQPRKMRMLDFPFTAYENDPNLKFKIDFVTPRTVRIRMLTTLVEPRPATSIMLAKEPGRDGSWKVAETNDNIVYSGDYGTIQINKNPWRIVLKDKTGRILSQTATLRDADSTQVKYTPFSFVKRGSDNARRINPVFTLTADEMIFGCGESATGLNKAGQKVNLFVTDPQGPETDQMYKPIPFFMSNRGYGMFMHTSAPVTCDFGATYIGLNKMFMGDENLDLFVFFGEPKDILDEYTDLVGKPGMPPLWSFGTWMSRITYFSEKEGYDVAANIRKNKYPCDVIHFDTGWFDVDWQCDYKFSENRFQNPQQMLKDLRSQGFHVCLWQLPYFTPKNRYFPELIEKNMYVKNGNGELPYEDVVLDFSNPETVKWYQDKLAGLLNIGVSAIKVDFGEAAPLNGIYASGKSGWYEHNLYPVRYDMAVSEITKKLHNENIMWARAAWAGSQRYPLHWGGDAATTNTGMLGTLRAGLSFGLSGFSFWSHDMGGFVKSTPEDLYCRWIPFGFLTSHTRAHGAPPTEPWLYDSKRVQDVFRKSAEMKYRLMPYVYAQAKECTEKGLPMLRALFVEFPDDPGAWKVDDEYLFGSQILVAPLLESGITGRTVYLPEGKWIDYQTEKVYEGGWHRIEAGSLPIIMLVRDGSVLPHLKLAQSTSEMDWSRMSLKVYSADKKQAEGLICLPTDNRIQVVKVDCAKAKPQLMNQVEGTSLNF